MFKSVCIAAAALFAAAAISLCIAAGGCGKSLPRGAGPIQTAGAPRAAVEPASPAEKTTPEPGWEIGPDAGLVGKLERPARVTATLYKAEGEVVRGADVRVRPGAWLIPESVILPPEAQVHPAPAAGEGNE